VVPGTYPSDGILEVNTFDFVPTAIPEWHPELAHVFPPSPGEPVNPLGAPLELLCPLLYTEPTKMLAKVIINERVSIFFLIIWGVSKISSNIIP
jgi:hypothetical protein